MSDSIAFKLADGYEDFSGGTVCYGSTMAAFDVAEALRGASGEIDPQGVFVVEDPALIGALDGYPGVVRTDPTPTAKVIKTAVQEAAPLNLTEIGTEEAETSAPEESRIPLAETAAQHGDDPDSEYPDTHDVD